ncbi:MAG TPA: Gfo/Idh/MocA family oxidoreductase [Candidatus Polarisedimenticolia bacterium]|nr:Gfo/Idh/MocA family oxidoreductase [Candidatus Polarisedimenticolia bacterium]
MRRNSVPNSFLTIVALLVCASADLRGQAKPEMKAEGAPLRVALAGLVHGHAFGFFDQFQRRTDLEVVGIAESDHQLATQFAKRYGLRPEIFYSDLEEMLKNTHPQAVLAYTNTYDHRRVVEVCARYGIPVMMEKPLAVSLEDARAIEKAARDAKVQVLVNYETTWYRSNQAAYDLTHENAIGEIRKIVVHDGHSGPKEINVGPEFLAWLSDPELNGAGALFDFGCYGADLATWLMDGRRPYSVTAVTQHIKPDVYPRVDDEATIILTYSRAQAIIQASWNWPFSRKDMEVYGQKGYAITVGRNQLRVRLPEKEEASTEARPLEKTKEDSVSYLRAVLLGGLKAQGLSSLETNVIVTEILDAARKSAATGKTVSLPGNP